MDHNKLGLLLSDLKNKGSETEIFDPLIYFPNALNSQGWDRSEPGIGNSTQASQVNGRDANT